MKLAYISFKNKGYQVFFLPAQDLICIGPGRGSLSISRMSPQNSWPWLSTKVRHWQDHCLCTHDLKQSTVRMSDVLIWSVCSIWYDAELNALCLRAYLHSPSFVQVRLNQILGNNFSKLTFVQIVDPRFFFLHKECYIRGFLYRFKFVLLYFIVARYRCCRMLVF